MSPHAVPYARQTLAHPNPLARFAHQQRHSRSLATAARHLPQAGTILDFGAGTGAFLASLGALRPDAGLFAYEPYMAIERSGVTKVADLAPVASASFDLVTCFEVCEHLTPEGIDSFLVASRRLLKPAGHLIVSVPIMEGMALPAKEASRALLFRRPSDYRAGELVRGLLGLPVARAADIRVSHKGFSHRMLWRRIEAEFVPVAAFCSPFAALPWWMNSQRFGVFKPR